MDFASDINVIIGIFLFTFGLNLCFGYFRGRQKKFSFRWFLYIHLPIPLVVFARLFANLNYRYIPVFLFAAVCGQLVGGKLEF